MLMFRLLLVNKVTNKSIHRKLCHCHLFRDKAPILILGNLKYYCSYNVQKSWLWKGLDGHCFLLHDVWKRQAWSVFCIGRWYRSVMLSLVRVTLQNCFMLIPTDFRNHRNTITVLYCVYQKTELIYGRASWGLLPPKGMFIFMLMWVLTFVFWLFKSL